MKKIVCILLAIFILLGFVTVCCHVGDRQFAYAEDNNSVYNLQVRDRTFRLVTLIYDGKPLGVRLYDYTLFGTSEIPVTIDVYSSPNFTIDFEIGNNNLIGAQKENRDNILDLFEKIIELFVKVDSLASTAYDGSQSVNGLTSEVYAYNSAKKGDKLEISFETYQMLTLAREMYNVTLGAFNPAVYRLVDLWGFSSRIYSHGNFNLPYDRKVTANEFFTTGYPLPDSKYIDAFSNSDFTDFSDNAVTLSEENGKYYVAKNVAPAVVDGVEYQQWIDLGGIAKGYAVDKARELIADLGIDRFYVNAGTSSMATGYEYDGGSTELGISDAFGNPYESVFTLNVDKSSISTSGQNIRKYVTDGVEYAHILDGVTGAPAQTGVKSVTVIVPETAGEFWATKGDCLTTALTVMGRDGIVEMVNGYLKDMDVKIIVQYQTLDGKQQLLANFDEKEIAAKGGSFEQFAWALKQNEDGSYYYDADAKFVRPVNVYNVALIVLGSLFGVGAVALVVYHFVKGKNRTVSNVQSARKDKPFKLPDILVYGLVALLVFVLFYAFLFSGDNAQVQIVTIVDDEVGETLFVYNVTRGEYLINNENANGWTVELTETADGVEVTFTRQINGEERFNVVSIVRGQMPSVKMTDSICGFHQDCVRNFPPLTRSGGAIVCSPNRLKIVTE